MGKGRHKRRKPLGVRLALGALALSPLAGGAAFALTSFSPKEEKTNSSATLAASSEVLPQTLQAKDATVDDTQVGLCLPFRIQGQTCSVEFLYSEDPQGTLLDQTPAAGTESETVELTYSKGPKTVTVPIIAGLTLEEAEELAWRAGLDTAKVKREDGAIALDTVIRTSRTPGARIPNGSKIVIFASTGMVRVPDWTGKPQELVEAEASELGLSVSFKTRTSNEPVGVVIEQERAGKRVKFSTPIVVTVSAPEEGESEELPSVVGMSQTEAISLLAVRGFLKIVTVIESEKTEDLVVVSMSPQPGEDVSTSDEIRLVLGKN